LLSKYRVIALVGLSGVGKSTLLRQISVNAPFIHLEASNLIKSELRLQSQETSSEELRRGDIAHNQELLVSAFHRAIDGRDGPFILDGHVLIDTDAGITDIPSIVFGKLGVELFCFVQAAPEQIVARRLSDEVRIRPRRDVDEISAHQDLALIVCGRIARELNVPAIVITPEAPDLFLAALTATRKDQG